MSKRNSGFNPKSLAQHFEAPDGHTGCFGWICGYSADSGFLEDAVERFSRRTQAQRAFEGRIAMAIMLDPSNPQILATEVPGVLHLPIAKPTPFKLLHAKIAVLGFRHETAANHWVLRLIVSTGNWTRETLEKSLDLVWSVDLTSDELKARDETLGQLSADLDAAWKLLRWLQNFYDLRALDSRRPGRQDSATALSYREVEGWISKARQFHKTASPQFFDNRNRALLDSLPEMIEEHAGTSSRNYLGMGSGFYESSSNENRIPSVLRKIVDVLQSHQLLTRDPEIDIFVNPKNCQAVSTSLASLTEAGWNVREASVASFFPPATRSLHAKFLFSASESRNSHFCNSPWVYLGSGNLTGPGFANKMSPSGGNLEAGVVFRPPQLRWVANKRDVDELVANYLPLQWESEFNDEPHALEAGGDMPEPEVNFEAAPIAFLFWFFIDGQGWLRGDLEPTPPVDVLDENHKPCTHDATRGFRWLGTMPRVVQARWLEKGKKLQATVPVIDEYGRFAATIIRQIDIEEAWNQLENFPMPPDDEDVGESVGGDAIAGGDSVLHQRSEAKYSVREMMQLIENIANKQVSVPRVDWTMWCTRLEQCLIQAAGSTQLIEFLSLRINPLSPLKHPPFRPDYAVTSDSNEGRMYESTLQRIESAWKVETLEDLGN